jgi:hypothetical protein
MRAAAALPTSPSRLRAGAVACWARCLMSFKSKSAIRPGKLRGGADGFARTVLLANIRKWTGQGMQQIMQWYRCHKFSLIELQREEAGRWGAGTVHMVCSDRTRCARSLSVSMCGWTGCVRAPILALAQRARILLWVSSGASNAPAPCACKPLVPQVAGDYREQPHPMAPLWPSSQAREQHSSIQAWCHGSISHL